MGLGVTASTNEARPVIRCSDGTVIKTRGKVGRAVRRVRVVPQVRPGREADSHRTTLTGLPTLGRRCAMP